MRANNKSNKRKNTTNKANPAASVIKYNGPLHLGKQGDDMITKEITELQLLQIPNGATVVTGFVPSYSSSAEFASFAAIYSDYRTLGMTVRYVPFTTDTVQTTANGLLGCGFLASEIYRAPGAPPTITTFLDLNAPSVRITPITEEHNLCAIRMSDIDEATFQTAATPSSVFAVSWWINEPYVTLAANQQVGVLQIHRVFQFRNTV